MKRTLAFLGSLTLPLWATAASPPTIAEFQQLAARSACEQRAPGKLVFAGDTMMLGECLRGAPGGEVRELRITSLGGLADQTLKDIEKYRGHIDHIIVDGLCAGSCATFVLPAAKRVTVPAHSYVLLQRAGNARVLDEERARIFAAFRQQAPQTTDEEINQRIEWFREKALADAPAQDAFADRTLACADWLDPTAPPARTMPITANYLLVTPDMAKRCLKSAKIESFWAPEAQDEFAPELGISRAQH